MAYEHYDLTLDGSAQRLSTALGLDNPSPSLRHVSLQPGASNANPIYLGGEAVSASSYAVRLAAPDTGVPPAPYIIEGYEAGPFRLSDFYVIGTAAETLHVGVVRF